jgi:hypothetical protein
LTRAIVGREPGLFARTSLVRWQRAIVGSALVGWHRVRIASVRLSAVIGRCTSIALRWSGSLRVGLGRGGLIRRSL